MPRSFLITNKRYRGEIIVNQEDLPSQDQADVTTRGVPSAAYDVTDVRFEKESICREMMDENNCYTSAKDDHPAIALVPGNEIRDEISRLYQGPDVEGGPLFPRLPDLLLTPTSGSDDDDDPSPSSPKSHGFDPDGRGSTPEAMHPCPECGKAYSTASNLARHRQSTHRGGGAEDRKARQCPHCDKLYVSSPAFSMHVRTHARGCACPHCGKRFSRPWLLQGHIRTHTGEKPFACPECRKTFADKSNLRAHVQTHSSEKPFVCGRCGKGFALKSYLYKHEESSCVRSYHHHHQHHHHRLYGQASFHSHYRHNAITNAAVLAAKAF